ncbi:MAG: hypothetical protein JWL68_5274 [Actinomycetia bacterium]|nr:hypothetical protein [Actinomycetes bacterium]
MSAVSVEGVRRHCWAALWQTFFRDAAAAIALACAVFLDPWGTARTIGIILLVIVVLGRVRLLSPVVLAVALGVALALVSDDARARASFAVPLICLGAVFLIYMADILWSVWQVRKLWPEPSLPQSAPSAAASLAVWPRDAGETPASGVESDGQGASAGEFSVAPPRQVYYDKDGIVGAGTPFTPLPLTVPLDTRKDKAQGIEVFTAATLLAYVGQHIFTQGVGDGQVHGYAHGPLSAKDGRPDPLRPTHFTYGLPYLDVGMVITVPVPRSRAIALLPVRTLRLHYPDLPPAHDVVAEVAGRSPSVHPERHYLRASASSWDGQLVASVYVSAALQGHCLRVVVRPYVLAPIVSDLKVADELRERRLAVQVAVAAGLTLRQFVTAARKVRELADRSGKPPRSRPVKRGLVSIRELYAQPIADNMHQADDADRILRVMELKIVRVTMDYLRSCNIDIEDYETQVTNYVQSNTIVGSGNIVTDGTFINSSVNSVNNQGSAKPGGDGPDK